MRRAPPSAAAPGREPVIERREYTRRRRRLMEEADAGCAVIAPAAPVVRRNRDIEYAYRPDSDFFYLTGFPEPEAVAVLLPGRPAGEYLLFCRERDPEAERLYGPRAGLEGACARYGADDAFPMDDIDDILPRLLEDRPRVWYSMGEYPEFDRRVIAWLHRLRSREADATELVDLRHRVHEMRLFKSRAEVRMIRRAVELTGGAHRRAMARCRPGMGEYALEAELVYELQRAGCRTLAYPCIVAAGRNACVPHYTANAGLLREGDLVLVDAGAEYGCYAADVTRTYPVSGRFGEEQRALYELVLAALDAAVAEAGPGRPADAPQRAAAAVLADGLGALGVLRNPADGDVMARLCAYPTGHWLGLDVHDVGGYRLDGEPRELEPGMVTTIEPGLYIDPAEPGVGARWRGLGIRVEDVALITGGGAEVLSAAVPKSVDELERLVGSEAA